MLKYYRAISVLEARKYIQELNLVSYPHMKKKDREKIFKSYKKVADQGKIPQKDIVRVEEMVAKINHGR